MSADHSAATPRLTRRTAVENPVVVRCNNRPGHVPWQRVACDGAAGRGMLSNTINEETPEWLWVVSILLIDVAHVYSTAFRVYFDREELTRRPWLYGLTPLLALVIGAAVYSEDSQLFWRLLAYLAVFHFVRQQYGWVAFVSSKSGGTRSVELVD